MDLLRPTAFFGQKLLSKVATLKKNKSATIAFFSSPPFLLLTLFFSSFLFLRYYDFGAFLAYETLLLTPFHSIQMTANFVRLVFKKSVRHSYLSILNP